MNGRRLLERFLRYVQIDTTAVSDAGRYPSSQGQWELGAILVRELQAMGIPDARQDLHGLVWATLTANTPGTIPTIAWNAHLDTSPEAPGAGIQPQIVRDYPGGDLRLPGKDARVIRLADNPELNQLKGCTLVTSDGTTLLGGDDKAGVAVIMETVNQLIERPSTAHGPVRILFTCDEEIGRGMDHVDLTQLNAQAAYTLDGPGANQIDVETFSADLATVTVRGVNIHPSIAKGRMRNAIRAAADFIVRLPPHMAPETTAGREGFFHAYQIEGAVAEVKLRILLRDFQTPQLRVQAALLQQIAASVEAMIPGISITIDVQTQYRNMCAGLAREPRAVQYAEMAHQRLGRTAEQTFVRGGTDGSHLTQQGLPTPNLSCGQHNPHSQLEWVCLEEMVQAGEVLVELLQIWARDRK